MGEAKRRGTPEDRAEAGRKQNEQALKMISRGIAPHYAFVLDRSPVGQTVLQQLKSGPAELKARATSPAVQLWESAPNFEFVIIWGTWGYSGGLTIPTADLNFLLNEALPATMKRTLEKGGLCAFMPAIDEKIRDVVVGNIAELQPTSGSSSN